MLRRLLAALAGGLLVVDVLSFFLWRNEIVRMLIGQIRLPLDVLTLLVVAAGELRCLRVYCSHAMLLSIPKGLSSFCVCPVAFVCLLLPTLVGVGAAVVEQVNHPASVEWIFALESGFVAVLLGAWLLFWLRASRDAREQEHEVLGGP